MSNKVLSSIAIFVYALPANPGRNCSQYNAALAQYSKLPSNAKNKYHHPHLTNALPSLVPKVWVILTKKLLQNIDLNFVLTCWEYSNSVQKNLYKLSSCSHRSVRLRGLARKDPLAWFTTQVGGSSHLGWTSYLPLKEEREVLPLNQGPACEVLVQVWLII